MWKNLEDPVCFPPNVRVAMPPSCPLMLLRGYFRALLLTEHLNLTEFSFVVSKFVPEKFCRDALKVQ